MQLDGVDAALPEDHVSRIDQTQARYERATSQVPESTDARYHRVIVNAQYRSYRKIGLELGEYKPSIFSNTTRSS